MPTYLLTWNPLKWEWENFDECVQQIKQQGYCERRWSCGITKRIEVGDRVFLLKQAKEPRGVIASGWAASNVYEAPHWDVTRPHDVAYYIDVQFDTLLDSNDQEAMLSRDELNSRELSPMHWDSQSSGITIPDSVANVLELRWSNHLAQPLPMQEGFLAEEVASYQLVTEGAVQQITVNRYERSAQARSICIKHHGYDCVVCGFNFEQQYGELGREYIHVHHVKPLAEIGTAYTLNPVADLRPVCPNCHAMLHQQTPALSIDELRVVLNKSD